MDDFKIKIPVCDQFDTAHDPAWAYRMCAICSLWMLLKHHDPSFVVAPMDLVHQALAKNAYLENIGWRHWGIVQLAKDYGLNLKYAEKFFYSSEEKEIGSKIITDNLKKDEPVIVSVFHHLNPSKGSHMVVVHGMQEFKGQLIGYYIQDPDASFRGHNYFLTKEEFFSGWRGGLIYSLDP